MAAFDANRRVLIIDDDESMNTDLRAVLAGCPSTYCGRDVSQPLSPRDLASVTPIPSFKIDSANQGEAGLELVNTAKVGGCPYSLAFVSARLTPGWDGIKTTRALLAADDA